MIAHIPDATALVVNEEDQKDDPIYKSVHKNTNAAPEEETDEEPVEKKKKKFRIFGGLFKKNKKGEPIDL